MTAFGGDDNHLLVIGHFPFFIDHLKKRLWLLVLGALGCEQ